MPQKQAQASGRPAPKNAKVEFKFKGFVRADLKHSDKEEFHKWAAEVKDGELWQMVCKLADSGYKVAVGESSIGVQASLSNWDGPEETRGWILTAQAGYADKAMMLLAFKHYVMFKGEWVLEEETPEDFLR